MELPENIINYTLTVYGDTTVNIVESIDNYDVHVLSVAMQQEKDLSDTSVICNGDTVALNYGKDFPQVFMEYECFNQTLYIQKTGNDQAYVHILYTTTTPIYRDVNIGGIDTENGFFYGDMVIATILFFMFTIMFFGGLWNKIIGVKLKRSMYNEYTFNSPEGRGNYID